MNHKCEAAGTRLLPSFHAFLTVDPLLGVNTSLLDESGFERLLAGLSSGLFETDVRFDLEKVTALERCWCDADEGLRLLQAQDLLQRCTNAGLQPAERSGVHS